MDLIAKSLPGISNKGLRARVRKTLRGQAPCCRAEAQAALGRLAKLIALTPSGTSAFEKIAGGYPEREPRCDCDTCLQAANKKEIRK